MIQRVRAWAGSAEFADAVLLTLGIRLTLLVVAPVAVILFGDEAARSRIPFDLWNAWDAPHYFEVAIVGYVDPARAVLFPLLPALLRVGSLALPPLVVGLTISVGRLPHLPHAGRPRPQPLRRGGAGCLGHPPGPPDDPVRPRAMGVLNRPDGQPRSRQISTPSTA